MATANREFKATLFSELFNDPQKLRELYNALANTNYDENTEIKITTLDDIFYKDMKTDVSFTIGDRQVVLMEHQSTINDNMPLRCLMYIGRVYEKITDESAIYNEKLLMIPTPEFIILYNGTKPFPSEKTYRLSDAFRKPSTKHEGFGHLELTVKVFNINPGMNDELLKKSETLGGYTAIVEHIRDNQRNGMTLSDAAKDTIKWGISQGVLSTFLKEHTGVNNMLMTEFCMDKQIAVWQEEHEKDLAAAIAEVTAEKDAALAEQAALIAELQAKLAELSNK